MATSTADAAAGDAAVETGRAVELDAARRMREQHADEAELAVKLREQTIKDLQESLKVAKAEAKRLRAEADRGAE